MAYFSAIKYTYSITEISKLAHYTETFFDSLTL